MYIDNDSYKKIVETMPILTIDFLIKRPNWDDEVLLVKRNYEPLKDKWWVPGGRLRKNEDMRVAIDRLLFEEVGIMSEDVKDCQFECFFQFMDDKSRWGCSTHTVSLLFEVKLNKEPIILLDDQSTEYKYGPIPIKLMQWILVSQQ